MNGRDAVRRRGKEGDGIVRAPSWRAETGLAAGHPVRLPAAYAPATAPLHLMFWPSQLASLEIRTFVGDLVERWGGIDPRGAPPRADQ